ncbi:2-C-methyl-D-erythritol 4-phosphate cytidylyltransferase [Paenalcaligenes niemegkensis]|uniref:2-C-methyl-D-erythritol 4-phosphate cytidylyltransferase n=1 Tax=Paenalcaligenes niemegkensis TaxID=2895469 RepID=UPI001EE8E474|nr:2-C-methyl-D-erythritol 4-phosphate cytidylyltransferase [Paenalcaligenes niemegkensis]MCQ9616920.1 2-C-methyl-D-erythritol 4-phosphate cytidylyltransferase [Paenalcaligenes niemegkensis]
MNKKIIAIVPAAGVGARARQTADTGTAATVPKQYELLGGLPMLRRTVQTLLADSRITQVRVIVSKHDAWVEQSLMGLERTVWREQGGATRSHTVYNALIDLDAGLDDWVLVHDAARPGLPPEALKRLIDTCLAQEHGGLLAQPVADTIKRGDANGALNIVTETVNRDKLWLAQTPQMFKAGLLLKSLQHAHKQRIDVTDEASAVEHSGYHPLLILGSSRNFKVTWPEDFKLMEKWL